MRVIFVLTLTILCGCNRTADTSDGTPVLTSRDQLDSHIGKTVTIRGEVSNTKIPQIIGVDVESYDPDLRGQFAEATGILHKYEVKLEDLPPESANRGPGVFYRLKASDPEMNAAVRTVLR